MVRAIESVEEFNDIIFDNIGHGKKYIFCDFYAEWCGPCLSFSPILEELSQKYNKNIYYIKYEIDRDDDMEELSRDEYDIDKIPTFMIFDAGNLKSLHKPITGCNRELIEAKLKALDEGIKRSDDF